MIQVTMIVEDTCSQEQRIVRSERIEFLSTKNAVDTVIKATRSMLEQRNKMEPFWQKAA